MQSWYPKSLQVNHDGLPHCTRRTSSGETIGLWKGKSLYICFNFEVKFNKFFMAIEAGSTFLEVCEREGWTHSTNLWIMGVNRILRAFHVCIEDQFSGESMYISGLILKTKLHVHMNLIALQSSGLHKTKPFISPHVTMISFLYFISVSCRTQDIT